MGEVWLPDKNILKAEVIFTATPATPLPEPPKRVANHSEAPVYSCTYPYTLILTRR